jgi:hypothetical protein
MNKFRICPTPSFQYNRLRKFVNTLFTGTLHGHSRKTLIMLTQALIEVRRAVLSELAREIPLCIHFKYRLRRIWRFLAKTTFDYQTPCQALVVWTLTALKDREYLEIILDWTQIRQDHVLVFSIPYHKRSIPLFWLIVSPDDYSPNKLEQEAIINFLSAVPQNLRDKLVFVGDRGFAKVEFLQFLDDLEVKFAIRVCGKVWIKTNRYQGLVKNISFSSNKIKWLFNVKYHKREQMVLNLLLKYDRDDSWYLASNIDDADEILMIYRRRMTIEEGFRDIKDGLLFNRLRLSRVDKVAKMLLVGVIAYLFAMIIGSQVERYPEIIQYVSILSKRKKKLLSIFRIGLTILRKYIVKVPLRLVPEAL